MKQLKEARIVEGNGLFKTKSIMDGDFDKSAFTSADLRNLTRIETGSKAQAAHLAPQRELHAHTGRRQTGNARNHRSRKILEHIEIPGHSEINRFRQTEYPARTAGVFFIRKVYRTITVGPDKKSRQSSNDARNGAVNACVHCPARRRKRNLNKFGAALGFHYL